MDPTYWAREDSGSANNPALNMTGAPARQITFVPETTGGLLGDLFIERPLGGGPDPDTLVRIGTGLYEFTFEVSGTLPTLKKHGAQQVPDQLEAQPVYIVTVHDYPAAGETTRLTFLPDAQATEAEMNAFGKGAIDVQDASFDPPEGSVCFATGTLIDTPAGPVPVEQLAPGDVVMTRDHGPMPILWVGQSRMTWPGSSKKALPILIAAGALGAGLPRRDLVVSPQHKMLVAGPAVVKMHGRPEVLVPARGLTGLPGVREMTGKRDVTYFHVLLSEHAILVAEGSFSESFYPGLQALKALRPMQVRRVEAALSGQGGARGYAAHPAPKLTVAQGRRLVAGMRGSRWWAQPLRQQADRRAA